jgi:hypothetical protein
MGNLTFLGLFLATQILFLTVELSEATNFVSGGAILDLGFRTVML